ncbi:MAG: hypothetical protein ABJB39_10940, partial [Chloroflexota bacterium]
LPHRRHQCKTVFVERLPTGGGVGSENAERFLGGDAAARSRRSGERLVAAAVRKKRVGRNR